MGQLLIAHCLTLVSELESPDPRCAHWRCGRVSVSDLAAPALLSHGQTRRHRGLGRHRGQRGEGVQVSHLQRIIGACSLYVIFVRAGTSVQLVCVIRDVTQPPSFIFWWVLWELFVPDSRYEPLLPQLYKISGQQNLLSSLIILFPLSSLRLESWSK